MFKKWFRPAQVHAYPMEHNPATNVWTRKADLPQASSHMGSATLVVNGKIVALGGQIDDIKVTAAVRSYNPTTNAWSSPASLPERRKGGVAGYYNGKLFYTGGQRDGDELVSTATWIGTLAGCRPVPQQTPSLRVPCARVRFRGTGAPPVCFCKFKQHGRGAHATRARTDQHLSRSPRVE